MISKLFCVAVACALLATVRAASAEDFKAGDIVISHPWSRATPAGAQVGAGYLVIENRGSLPDRFLGGSVEAATGFELHDIVLEGGIMKMRQLTGIELPPGSSIEAKPGGLHIMFVGVPTANQILVVQSAQNRTTEMRSAISAARDIGASLFNDKWVRVPL